MIAVRCQCQLSASRPGPKLVRHRNRLEGSEAIGDLPRAPFIRGKASQLENHQVADQNETSFNSHVEPGRELRKAAIANPGPSTGIEESWPIEL